MSIDKKHVRRKSFPFSFSIQPMRLSGLISIYSSDLGRPAKHLYGLDRVSQSLVVRPNLNLLSRAAIQRRVPVQKLDPVNPAASQASRRRLSRASRDSSFLRPCGWGGVAKLFFNSFRRLVMGPCGRPPRVKTSRGDSEPDSSPPGGRIPRSVAAGDRAQSSPRSAAVPNADPGCFSTSELGR